MSTSRRSFVKKSALTLGSLTIGSQLSARVFMPKSREIIIGHNTHKYRVVPGWGLLDAGKNPVNDCHEMVEDAKDRLIMCTNETKNNIIIYDKSGKLLEAWGTTYPGAHGLTVGNEGGEQFLLLTDTARHQVIKTDLKGKEIFKIDYPKETGKYDYPGQFVPTETAVNPLNGDIYVADGYGANYIIQYDSQGKYIRHFGGRGKSDDTFDTCHGVLVDTRNENNTTLLVTDRMNQSLKRFTLNGIYIETIHLPGTFICRPVLRGKYIYGAAFRSTDASLENSGYIQILDENMKVVSTPGGSEPVYVNGKLQTQKKEDPNNVFMHPHDVYVDSDENIYIPQWASKKTYPVKLERV
jgi:DNA-binding beta-propeller fold protein YncE